MAERAVVEEWVLRLARNGQDVGGATLSMNVMALSPDIARDGLHRALDELIDRGREGDGGENGDLEGV